MEERMERMGHPSLSFDQPPTADPPSHICTLEKKESIKILCPLHLVHLPSRRLGCHICPWPPLQQPGRL